MQCDEQGYPVTLAAAAACANDAVSCPECHAVLDQLPAAPPTASLAAAQLPASAVVLLVQPQLLAASATWCGPAWDRSCRPAAEEVLCWPNIAPCSRLEGAELSSSAWHSQAAWSICEHLVVVDERASVQAELGGRLPRG